MVPYIILFLYLLAVGIIFVSIDKNFTFFTKQMRKASRLNVTLREKYQNHDISQVMKSAGLPFNLYHYQLFRNTLALLLAIILLVQWFMGIFNPSKFILLFVLYFVTIPTERIFGITSPFQRLIDMSQQRKRDQYNEELYLAIAQLKNSFLVRKDRPVSSQLILDEIRVYTNKTRHIFNRFMGYWMMGEQEKAIAYFDKAIGTKEAKKLSQVFTKLDSLNPLDMRDQLEAYQVIYRTERETKKKKKNELKSNI